MKRILIASACVCALSVPAIAQTGTTTAAPATKMENGKMTPPDASKGTSTDAKRGVPGNPTAGGDASQSTPKSSAPGASKAGGG